MRVFRSRFITADPAAQVRQPPAPRPAPETPPLVTKLARLRRELALWAKAGAPLAPAAVRKERLAICAACEYYAPAGNLGLGECRFPGCGCTRVKAALATSRCPHKPPKWCFWEPAKPPLAPA